MVLLLRAVVASDPAGISSPRPAWASEGHLLPGTEPLGRIPSFPSQEEDWNQTDRSEQLLNDLSNLSFIIIIIILTTVQEMKAVITPALNRKALLFCLQAGHSRFLKLIYDSLDFG